MKDFLSRFFSLKDSSLAEVEKILGYKFKDRSLLKKALTHPSVSHELKQSVENNQRLEFLGDAVLNLVLSEKLYKSMPEDREGHLTLARSALSKGDYLASLAKKKKLNNYMIVSSHEKKSGGKDKKAAMEDLLEALIGAIYIDGGFRSASKIVLSWYKEQNAWKNVDDLMSIENPKGRLQEFVAKNMKGSNLKYSFKEEGFGVKKKFSCQVIIDDRLYSKGKATSKKAAEAMAAGKTLKVLENASI